MALPRPTSRWAALRAERVGLPILEQRSGVNNPQVPIVNDNSLSVPLALACSRACVSDYIPDYALYSGVDTAVKGMSAFDEDSSLVRARLTKVEGVWRC